MQRLRRRLKTRYQKRGDVLFHGTGYGSDIIRTNVMLSARSGWHLISFTRDPAVAIHFATLHPQPTILVFDRAQLSTDFKIARFRDGDHDESEEAIWGRNIDRVCDYVVDIITGDRAEEGRLKAQVAQNQANRPSQRKNKVTCSIRRPHTLNECDPKWEQKRQKRLAQLSQKYGDEFLRGSR